MKRLMPALFALLLLCGCSTGPTPVGQEFFAMDTVMTVTAYGTSAGEAVTAAVAEIDRLENLLSRTREGSDVYRLNTDQTAEVSPEAAHILTLAQEWYRKTGGAFDVTVAPLSAAWGFGGGEYRVPSQAELDGLLVLVDGGSLTVDGAAVTLPRAGMAVDLGGIAKGFAADRVKNLLAEYGVDYALLDLGGSITALGTRPDGTGWRVAVRDPRRADGAVGVLALEDCSAVTSGGYQRYFEENGQVYHHILDPRTGCPAASGLLSATVVCEDCTLADLLSTAVFVLGEEGALDLWHAEGGFELLLVTEDGRLVVTDGLTDRFTSDETCGYTLEYAQP